MSRLLLLTTLALLACSPPPAAEDEETPTAALISDTAHCDDARDWDPGWAAFEAEVLTLVNEVRAQGADCHSEGVFGPVAPLSMDPNLRCAARLHSKDMSDRSYFDHSDPEGGQPWDRVDATDYGGYRMVGENIALGSPNPEGVVAGWLGSDGHCANIMNGGFEDIGVGYYHASSHYWTQVFATAW